MDTFCGGFVATLHYRTAPLLSCILLDTSVQFTVCVCLQTHVSSWIYVSDHSDD